MVYISVAEVTAAYGFALTAGHLEQRNAARPQVTKGSCPFRSVPRLGSACPRSGPAPWASRGARRSKAKAKRGGLPAGLAREACAFLCRSCRVQRGCDLMILFFTSEIKRSQPSAAPTLGVIQHKNQVDWRAAIASRLAPTEEQSGVHPSSSPLHRPSVSSPAAFDPPAPSAG
jgi:hypothetical protein